MSQVWKLLCSVNCWQNFTNTRVFRPLRDGLSSRLGSGQRPPPLLTIWPLPWQTADLDLQRKARPGGASAPFTPVLCPPPPLPWGLLPGKQIHKPVTTSSSIQQVLALSPWPLINISSFSLPLRPGSHTPGGVCNTGRLFPAQVLKY